MQSCCIRYLYCTDCTDKCISTRAGGKYMYVLSSAQTPANCTSMLQMSDKLPVENPSPGEEQRCRRFTAPPLEEQRSRQFLSPPTFHLSRSASPSPIRDRLSVVTPKFLSRSASPSPRQAIQLLFKTSILGK